MARTDELTGVANRRHFAERWTPCWRGPARAARPGCCCSTSTASSGSTTPTATAVGDQALVEIARRLRGRIRRDDDVARWGGEEFIVLARDAPDDRALRRIGETIRHAIADRPFEIGGHTLTSRPRSARRGSTPAIRDRESIWSPPTRRCTPPSGAAATRPGSPPRSREVEALHEEPEAARWRRRWRSRRACARGCRRCTPSRSATCPAGSPSELGLSPGFTARCRLAGLLHDIGKIAIPDRCWPKPGPLTTPSTR